MPTQIDLTKIRQSLIRLEDSIIFSLFGRAEYKINEIIYQPQGIIIPDFKGSFLDYMLRETEVLHASAGRYIDQREHPFSSNLPSMIVQRRKDDEIIKNISINKNKEIQHTYLEAILNFCEPGDDNQYGSSALWDIRCLQDLSKRIHFGTFVAESKFQNNPIEYSQLVFAKDLDRIREKLRDLKIEDQILQRVSKKGKKYEVNPQFIHDFYRDKVIPLTIDIEIEYLIQRASLND